ncbi:MAG TPA: IS110 family transposase [Planctomycetota bacterium]|nr:IS110 family transposase [Planctomycetota bacterium]
MTELTQATASAPSVFVGIDLGVRRSHLCAIHVAGRKLKHGSVASTADGFRSWIASFPGAKAVLETGASSRWVEALLRKAGWDAVTVDAAHVAPELRSRGEKSDRHDAARLAELLRVGSTLLSPVVHKPEQFFADYSTVRARASAVAIRTKLINSLRGLAKAVGEPLKKTDARVFSRAAAPGLRDEYRSATAGILRIIAAVDAEIRLYDEELERVAERHVIVKRLRKVPGVGLITAVTFALVVFRPARFRDADALAAYLGLTPRRAQSGDQDPQCGITKQGNKLLRTYLIQAAHRLINLREDSDLKRWADAYLARGGGKKARKVAVVAVARRLAVVLYTLWKSGAEYDPLYQTKRAAADAEARLRLAG